MFKKPKSFNEYLLRKRFEVVWNRHIGEYQNQNVTIVGNIQEFIPNNTLQLGNDQVALYVNDDGLQYRRNGQDENLTERIEQLEERLESLQNIVNELQEYINRNNE